MLSFSDAMSQINQLIEDFPTMHDNHSCDTYLSSLTIMPTESKAEQLGKAVWCLHLVENCKQQIEQLLEEDELSYLQKYEWTAIQKNNVMAGAVFMNIITSHVQHLQEVHSLKFYSHIQSIQDQISAVLELSKSVINDLPDEGGTFIEIGQKTVLGIGRTILD